MPTTAISALKHVRSAAPYNAVTFAEQNGAILGRSARLRGYDFVSLVADTLTLASGAFVSFGLALNPSEPARISGLVAETVDNVAIDVTGLTGGDFYVFALVDSPSEATTVDFVAASTPPPGGQYAPIIRRIAGQYILEDGLGSDSLFEETVDVRVDSGASQFFLTPTAPSTVTITGATLPDGSLYAGNVGFTGAPAFTVAAANYIWFNTSTALIENTVGAFPAGDGYLRLWVLTLDGSGNVTSLSDRRPWFSPMAGTAGAGTVDEAAGTYLEADLTSLGSQDPAPQWLFGAAVLTWNATTSTLSWTGTINVQFTDELAYVINTIAASSVATIADGDYVYTTLNRAGGAITLVRNAGAAPAPAVNRVLMGRRTGVDFLMTNGQTLYNSATIPGAASAVTGAVGVSRNHWEAILGAAAPTLANPFITAATLTALNLADLADVSVNEAAAFNAATGATGANPFATMADVTAAAGGVRGAGAASIGPASGATMTHSFGAASNYILIFVNIRDSNDSGFTAVYLFRRSTSQAWGWASTGTPAGTTVHNGIVVVAASTNLGAGTISLQLNGFAGTTIGVLNPGGASPTMQALVVGLG